MKETEEVRLIEEYEKEREKKKAKKADISDVIWYLQTHKTPKEPEMYTKKLLFLMWTGKKCRQISTL